MNYLGIFIIPLRAADFIQRLFLPHPHNHTHTHTHTYPEIGLLGTHHEASTNVLKQTHIHYISQNNREQRQIKYYLQNTESKFEKTHSNMIFYGLGSLDKFQGYLGHAYSQPFRQHKFDRLRRPCRILKMISNLGFRLFSYYSVYANGPSHWIWPRRG